MASSAGTEIGIDTTTILHEGERIGAYFLSNKIPEGTIPFTLGMSVAGDEYLTDDIYVPADRTLYIDGHIQSTNILYLGDYDITCHSDGLIVIGTKKAFTISPDIRIVDQSTEKIVGLYHSLQSAANVVTQGQEIQNPRRLYIAGK